jgi:hypothetical protein
MDFLLRQRLSVTVKNGLRNIRFKTKDMRIKINDKIYRLKEIESGVDSLMELVEEPKFKDGDFLHSDWGDENITIICRKINGNDIYFHVSKSNCLGLKFDKNGFWPNHVDFRLATEAEKQELLDALAKEGKRWNAEKKCVEDMPKHKFKKGDKVVLKSGYKKSDGLIYLDVFDLLIGKPLTIRGYTDTGYVHFSDCPYCFQEDWLEPYVDELKEGDLAIFWDNVSRRYASVRIFGRLTVRGYCDIMGVCWDNAIKFESKEQFEKLIKGEI